jgi:hypothetical protein
MNWTCPHCNMLQAVTHLQREIKSASHGGDYHDQFDGRRFKVDTIKCANEECGKLTINVVAGLQATWNESYSRYDAENALFSGQIYPSPSGKPQPNYIPQAIVSDYQEACLIKGLSPKASATLARRAVQGIIRDFAGITKATLFLEIDELRKQVEERTAAPGITMEIVEAIDNIRSVGNIGAHMEKDVNLIIDVEPEEAELMIELIEDMFEDLYVARNQRGARAARMKRITAEKAAARNQSPVLLAAPESE